MIKFPQPIAEQIWKMKYQLKTFDGENIDKTVEDTWARVAEALAQAEKPEDQMKYRVEFYKALSDFKFLPAGRITSGAGTGRKVTLANCFTMGTIPDDLSGIFDALKEAALTMQQGGGIGYDFSTLRPKGAHVKGVDADASGPLTFMDTWDAMCRTIISAGERRGAMMATMDVSHPDIEAFIDAKRDPLRLRMFNLSVMVGEDFMTAVKDNAQWDLVFNGKVYKSVNAKSLWDKIMMSTYKYAEPGVLFMDRINEMHNIAYLEKVRTTNPCGEKPMGPYASCLLGSLNLSRFVLDPFTSSSRIDWKNLEDTIYTAIRMLDNVIEVTKYPLEKQELKARQDRQIGLGVTGLADMLIMLSFRYGSVESEVCVEELMHFINDTAYYASSDLAVEKGSFPTFDAEKFLDSGFMKTRQLSVRETIRRNGVRNALITSIAPTGTISLYAGNVSSGIEPVFAKSYDRKILNMDGTHTIETVKDYAVLVWEQLYGDEPLPNTFVTAQTLTPSAHIRIQAAAQKHVDSSISKTTNCPEDITLDQFKDVYMLAWDTGCKGCTTYRPNDVTGSVLSSNDEVESTGGACTIEVDPESGQLIKTCDQ